MKANTMRNIYITSVFIVLFLIFFWFGNKSSFWNVEPDSLILVGIISILFILSVFIGRFLYMFYSGVNIFRIEFFNSEAIPPKQEFRIYVYFGIKKEVIDGSFENTLGINDSDLRLLIYSQTTRHMLRNLIRNGVETDINYTYKNQDIRVTYFERITNLYYNF